MHRLCNRFNTLLEEAKKNHGLMTFQMVDRYLPDEGGDPKMVDDLLIWLDENTVDLIHDVDTPIDDPDYVPEKERPVETVPQPKLTAQEERALLSRDPIRMYLSQMGNIPLLTRRMEIYLAKQIEITRKRFRRGIMEADFALEVGIDTLEKVNSKELPFERTLRTSETENTRKEQIEGRMPKNLPLLKVLFEQHTADHAVTIDPEASAAARCVR